MSKRKIDPATGKTIPRPSDLNRKKKPKKKLRTAAEKIARNESAGEKRTWKAKTVKRSQRRQVTAMATGDKAACKIINTMNLNNNGGEHLLPEFRAYVGDLLAEEDFVASQPGKPVVRRDQAAEVDKLWRSNHWVGIGASQILAMANLVFISMQLFAEDELGQDIGPDLFRNQDEIAFCDRIVQLEGLISIAMTGSAFAVKDAGTS